MRFGRMRLQRVRFSEMVRQVLPGGEHSPFLTERRIDLQRLYRTASIQGKQASEVPLSAAPVEDWPGSPLCSGRKRFDLGTFSSGNFPGPARAMIRQGNRRQRGDLRERRHLCNHRYMRSEEGERSPAIIIEMPHLGLVQVLQRGMQGRIDRHPRQYRITKRLRMPEIVTGQQHGIQLPQTRTQQHQRAARRSRRR